MIAEWLGDGEVSPCLTVLSQRSKAANCPNKLPTNEDPYLSYPESLTDRPFGPKPRHKVSIVTWIRNIFKNITHKQGQVAMIMITQNLAIVSTIGKISRKTCLQWKAICLANAKDEQATRLWQPTYIHHKFIRTTFNCKKSVKCTLLNEDVCLSSFQPCQAVLWPYQPL